MNPNRLSLLIERTIEQNKNIFPYRCSILDTSNPQQICKYEEALFEAFIRTNNQIILKIWDWDFTNRRVRTRISYNNQIVYAMIDEDEHIVFSVSVNTSTLNTQFAQLGFVVPDSNKSYCEALNLFANQNYDISGFQIINFCNYFKAIFSTYEFNQIYTFCPKRLLPLYRRLGFRILEKKDINADTRYFIRLDF